MAIQTGANLAKPTLIEEEVIKKVGKFEKVSYDTFKNSILNESGWSKNILDIIRTDGSVDSWYNDITLPTRSTEGSAGYDFYSPYMYMLEPYETALFYTGIKVRIKEGYVLMIFPRSSYGIKFHITLKNTVGIIDSDYYNNETNEGQIIVVLKNNSDKLVEINRGDRFCQGIFVPFGITYDDNVNKIRIGGIGSTD